MDLLQQVKEYLNISYEDKLTDDNLSSAIERGKTILNDYAGAELDFDEEGAAKQLLFDYCRYVRSQATEMFETNYKHDLISLRENKEALNAYKNADTG